MSSARIKPSSQQVTWPSINQNVVLRHIGGPRGQIEVIDTSDWGVNQMGGLDEEASVTVSGRAGISTYTLSLSELSASPSIFANVIHNADDPISAVENISLRDHGVTIDNKRLINAFEIVVRCMKCGRVNTALWDARLAKKTTSTSGHYDFEFQIQCILLAQKLAATRLVEILALEVSREWLRAPLSIQHLERATEVNGALDKLLIDWTIQIEYEEDELVDRHKQLAFTVGIRKVKNFRDVFEPHFAAHPNSRYMELEFASTVLEATKAKAQAKALKAAAAREKEAADNATKAAAGDVEERVEDDKNNPGALPPHISAAQVTAAANARRRLKASRPQTQGALQSSPDFSPRQPSTRFC